MVTSWPKGLPGLGTGAERLARRIKALTDGELTIKVYAAGELVPAFEVFDTVAKGTADMYHSVEYYFQGKSPALNFFAGLPMGLNNAETKSWIYHGGGQELWDELSGGFNLKPFMTGSNGPQMGGWFNKEINTLEDLKGLKVRMPGLGGEVLRRLGANTQTLPGSEIYAALQSGVIDATEWVGPWNDMAFGFQKLAKYYYWPGFHEPGPIGALALNIDVWNSLAPQHQAAFRIATAAEVDVMLGEFNLFDARSLRVLIEKHGVQLRRFSDEILTRIGEVSGEVVREAGQGSELAMRIYDSFMAARRASVSWRHGGLRSIGATFPTPPIGGPAACPSNTRIDRQMAPRASPMPINRRSMLATVAAGGMATSLPAKAKSRQLSLVTAWPKNFPGPGTGAERLAKRIGQLTNGELKIKVFAAGELVPAFECFDAVSAGTADIYHSVDYYFQGKSRLYNFFAAVPYGLTSAELKSWLYFGGGQELWDELSARFNIKPFLAGGTGVQMGGWFNKEINDLEDLRGLKIRMPGLGGEVLRRLGASTFTIPGGEAYQAMQSGVIDAVEWIGPWNDMAFGFHKIADYYYWPGFQEAGASLTAGFNLEVWNSLEPAHQAAIRISCAAESDVMLAEFRLRDAIALRTLTETHGVEMRHFSDDILTAMGDASGEVIREAGQGDKFAERVYKSFLAARKVSKGWHSIGEMAYGRARQLPFDYSG